MAKSDEEHLSQASGNRLQDVLSVSTQHATEEGRALVASQTQLIWWRFRKHKLAVVSGIIVILLYLMGFLCEFVAPYRPETYFLKYKLAPPSKVHIRDQEGGWHWPFVYRRIHSIDRETLRDIYTVDYEKRYPIRFFLHSEEYQFWSLVKADVHLFGIDVDRSEDGFFLLGTDRLGRDLFSRAAYGARLSLSIGLLGIVLSFMLGIVLGGISGYYAGWLDNLIQRFIEIIRSIPTLPLWMSLAAAVPPGWSVVQNHFAISLILSLITWTGVARVVRGRFLSMREDDFVMAARIAGASEMRIILVHMVPSFMSHIIASLTFSIPRMILGETGLSFLGLGLREPAISWGILLRDAQQIAVLATQPWLLLPAILVVLTVLTFNFLGDGIRDAADPYGR